ncbi:MAG: LytTR family DNA-binding domain-containing protein [Bacteroidales bacterium]
MGNPFRQPYREAGSGKSRFYTIISFGLFIFLFLYLFKPFGLATLKPLWQLLATLGFGAITAFVLLVFKFLIEPLVVVENWTLGKSLIWDVIIASSIGAANYFFICTIFKLDFAFKYFLYSVWTAILVGSIPVTIVHIMVYNKMYRNALKEADIPQEKLFWEEEVRITAGNDKNNDLRFNPRSIIYLCSNDNYVTIVTFKDNTINKVTIRGTLKSAEYELRRNKGFIRCHKCYIVNLDFIDKIAGHSQNMKIKLFHTDEVIPVSRSKVSMLSERFS